jgi:hypothetical protein
MTTVINILMYAVSLDLQLPARVTIHNQCLNIKLISSVYFGNGTVYPKLSGQQIDIGTKMKVYFEINTTQDEPEGALLFKLQRYSASQYNIDTLTTGTNKKEATNVHMLVAWEIRSSKPSVCVVLVENTEELTWNEDKLKKLYDKNCGWLREYGSTMSDTWLMDNNMTLKILFNVRNLKRSFELGMHIYEEKDSYAMSPLCVDLMR